eukprot:3231134-Amphidinium_carterae.1
MDASAKSSGVLMNGGHLALDMFRVSAGFPRWGSELSCETLPLETGFEKAVAFGKQGGFLGETALLQHKALRQEVRVLCTLTAACSDPWLWGGEPILIDGKYSGRNLTSATRVPVKDSTESFCQSMGIGLLNIRESSRPSHELANLSLSVEVGSQVIAVQAQEISLPKCIF